MIKKNILVVLIICLANYWIYRIFRFSFIVGLFLIAECVFLYQLYTRKTSTIIKLLTYITFFILLVLALLHSFDSSILKTSNLEDDLIKKRHEYYANELGVLYRNRIGLYYINKIDLPLYKYERNFFSGLDLNLYFFGSHPRERVGYIEYGKFPFIFLPFFLYGFITIAKKGLKPIFSFFLIAAFANAFVSAASDFASMMLFPLVALFISVGCIDSLEFLGKNFKLWGK